MIHELRIYTAMPGRLPDLLKRFENQTLRVFAKHGIKQAGFWTVLVGDSNQKLYYLLEWESMADREKRWNAFVSDPEWIKIRMETEVHGPLTESFSNCFLQPTAFSSVR